MVRYPAFSEPTEEEKGFPQLLIRVLPKGRQVEYHSSENYVAGVPSRLHAQLRQAIAQFKRDFATWVALSRSPRGPPLNVTLTANARALVDEADNVALASLENDVAYVSYALLRDGVPVGFRLGVFECLFGLSLIHISEPTRLRRISYAVFCLKKKKKTIMTLIS